MCELQVNLPTPQSELQRSNEVELALSAFNFQKESVGVSKSVRCNHKYMNFGTTVFGGELTSGGESKAAGAATIYSNLGTLLSLPNRKHFPSRNMSFWNPTKKFGATILCMREISSEVNITDGGRGCAGVAACNCAFACAAAIAFLVSVILTAPSGLAVAIYSASPFAPAIAPGTDI